MPRGILICLAAMFGPAWLLASTPTIRAADTEDVKFETCDHVELHGTFYPGKKTEPCVVILPKLGTSYKEDDWDKLATALQKTGCAVLMFDYRGQGDSKKVNKPDKFWEDLTNRTSVKGFNPQKLKAEIDYKDFTRDYLPHLVNDMVAAREFLDRKNDGGQCNSRAIVTIGAEDGGVLAAMWSYSEMYRFRKKDGGGKLGDPEGTDLLGSIWLSPTGKLGSGNMATNTSVLTWIADVGAPNNHNIPMTFFYGANDASSKDFANSAFRQVKPAKVNQVTITHAIKDTNLKGAKLLDSDTSTQEDILTYLKALKDAKSVPEWDTKDSKKNHYFWVFKGTAFNAKDSDEDYFAPLPTRMLP